ncbi:unnamed protein product, partial [Discosporangium mesarthrocarpum]
MDVELPSLPEPVFLDELLGKHGVGDMGRLRVGGGGWEGKSMEGPEVGRLPSNEFIEDLIVCWDFLHLMGITESEVYYSKIENSWS